MKSQKINKAAVTLKGLSKPAVSKQQEAKTKSLLLQYKQKTTPTQAEVLIAEDVR